MSNETTDAELAAMNAAFAVLKDLRYDEQLRAMRWLDERLDDHRRRRSHVDPGDRVRHGNSGWGGVVVSVEPDTTGMAGAQGALVTVQPDPLYPGAASPRTITVTADELELRESGSEA